MLDIVAFGHINIVVDSADEATEYYQALLGAIPVQSFPRFKNTGLARGAGFLEDADKVEISINFSKIPNTQIYLELTSYHYPKDNTPAMGAKPNAPGGPRHIALRVADVKAAYKKIVSFPGVKLINSSVDYQPHQLDKVSPDQFMFYDDKLEKNAMLKDQAAQVSSLISFFYFTDKYGVTWELEEAPDTIEDPALSI